MIRVKQAVIVEGKYDKIKLSSVIDGLIIQTDGFGIFKDKEKMDLIRRIAKKRGIIIMTDSDSAGFLIRSHIGGSVTDGQIIHAYIPDILGKERRKTKHSAEGKVGVEGVSVDKIIESLKRAGVIGEIVTERSRLITKTDFFEDGLTGGKNSSQKRNKLLKLLDLPARLSTNSMLGVLNSILTFEEYKDYVSKL